MNLTAHPCCETALRAIRQRRFANTGAVPRKLIVAADQNFSLYKAFLIGYAEDITKRTAWW